MLSKARERCTFSWTAMAAQISRRHQEEDGSNLVVGHLVFRTATPAKSKRTAVLKRSTIATGATCYYHHQEWVKPFEKWWMQLLHCKGKKMALRSTHRIQLQFQDAAGPQRLDCLSEENFTACDERRPHEARRGHWNRVDQWEGSSGVWSETDGAWWNLHGSNPSYLFLQLMDVLLKLLSTRDPLGIPLVRF